VITVRGNVIFFNRQLAFPVRSMSMGINPNRPPGDVRGVVDGGGTAELTSREKQIVADIEQENAVAPLAS
jgi:hypothetical protein